MAEPQATPLSLARMRDLHVTLLQKMNAEPETHSAAFLASIADFQQQAQAAGARIAGPDERSEVQSIINFWQTVRINAGQRPATMVLLPFDKVAALAAAGGRPPYMGLSAFHDEDSASFFGRYATIRRMVGLVKSTRLLAVTGMSGSGKSSVVRGGLIPQLRDGAFDGIDDDGLTDSTGWLYPEPILPGNDPMAALTAVWGSITTAAALPAALDARGAPVIITIDQFEEVFTLSPGGVDSGAALDDSRRLFLDALLAAATGGRFRHIVIVTMRSEFDSYVRVHEDFAKLFNTGRIVIDALPASDLRQAIELPAERLGVGFEAGLVDELVNSVLGEPAGLPLLQFTLLALWKRRNGDGPMRMQAYKDIGGNPRIVLARSADAVYESLKTEQDRTLSRRIFTALVTTGSGQEATGRRRNRSDLDVVSLARDNVNAVLEKWRDAGMIRISPAGAITPASEIEVAHEALVRNWKMLVGWVEEDFAASRNRHAFLQRAGRWQAGHEETLGELALAEARKYERLEPVEKAYIAASEKAVAEAKAYENLQTRRWLIVSTGILLSEVLIIIAFIMLLRTELDPPMWYILATIILVIATFIYIQFLAGSIVRKAMQDFLRRRFNLSEARAISMRRWVGRGIGAVMASLVLGLVLPPIIAGIESNEEDERAEAQQRKIAAAEAAQKKKDDARDTAFQATQTTFNDDWSVSNDAKDWPAAKPARTILARTARSVGNTSVECPTGRSVFMIAPGLAAALLDDAKAYDFTGCTVDFAPYATFDGSWTFAVTGEIKGPPVTDQTSTYKRLAFLKLQPVNAAGNRPPKPLPLALAGKDNLGTKYGNWPAVVGYEITKDSYMQSTASGLSVNNLPKPGAPLMVAEFDVRARTDPSFEGGPNIDLRTGNVIGIHLGTSDLADTVNGDTSVLAVTPALLQAIRDKGVKPTLAEPR